MRPLSKEEDDDSDEDYDNVHVAQFIAARSGRVVPKEPVLKRPTTRHHEKEALESALKRNKEKRKRRRLVKGGKLVNEEDLPPENIVDVKDEEVNEEPASLICKSSKKFVLVKPKGGSSVKGVEIDKEKSVEEKESGEKSKSEKKEKSVKKSQKRNASDKEEHGSFKKAKVKVSEVDRRENLKKQRVLWGRVFDVDILEMSGIR
ncbi:uncharacterized protein [Nicotiana tomentosiformis]|uniref:uncharacterized protein n=1 Tax=Nicotiana tomentosiformis TaxID=4098 RepID=UPI00388C4A17